MKIIAALLSLEEQIDKEKQWRFLRKALKDGEITPPPLSAFTNNYKLN